MAELMRGEEGEILDGGCGSDCTSIAVARAYARAKQVAVGRVDAGYIEDGGHMLLEPNIRNTELESRVRAVQGDLTAHPFDNDSFDAAVSVHPIDHLGNAKEAGLAGILRAQDSWMVRNFHNVPGLPLTAVVKVVRVVAHRRQGVAQTSEETAWWVSTVALSAAQFQDAIRGHWSVENQNHHVRDVVMGEDACRVRQQPGILARLRSPQLHALPQ